jgi:hypothetical protein
MGQRVVRIPDLHAELGRAIRLARHPPIAVAFAEQGFTRRIQWGFACVTFFGVAGQLYEPAPDGNVMAFIVPVVEDGDTIDLCAINPFSQHIGCRLGYGHGLGLQALEKARMGAPLKLMGRPLDWLRDPVGSVYLFNIATLPVALDGVSEIICASLELAERAQSLLPPSEANRVVVDV